MPESQTSRKTLKNQAVNVQGSNKKARQLNISYLCSVIESMKPILQKSLSIILVVLTLAFTSGVSVYNHYCNCSKQAISSVFVEVTCGQTHGNSCCASKAETQPTCCSQATAENSCTHHSSCDAEGCCRTDVTVVQIESEYQISHTSQLDQDLVLITANFNSEIPEEPAEFIKTADFYIDTSPPFYGRRFLIAVHQLKLDVPVC